MKVAVLSPTTSQLVEKMAVLFPEGVDLVGHKQTIGITGITVTLDWKAGRHWDLKFR